MKTLLGFYCLIMIGGTSVWAQTAEGDRVVDSSTPNAVPSVPATTADGPKLYNYLLRIGGAPQAPRWELELYTKRVLAFLEKQGLADACVDIKRDILGDVSSKVDRHNVIQLLLTKPIDPTTYAELQTALCAGSHGPCKLYGGGVAAEVRDLHFFVISNRQQFLNSGPNRTSEVSFQLAAGQTQFPRVSSSCVNANSGDSSFFTARSQGIRDILAASGIKIATTVGFGLSTADNQHWWGFGMPDARWTNHPTTKDKVELAPKDILKQLK